MLTRLRKRFNVTEYGDGPVTLFFIHGLGTSQSIWREVAPAFAGRYRIVLMDLMGCGGSDFAAWDPARYGSLQSHAEDVAEVAEQLSSQNTVLVLHSIAAMIGLMSDLHAPHVFDAHVMVAPSPCYQNMPGYAGGFDPDDLQQMLALLDQDVPAWAKVMSQAAAAGVPGDALAREVEQALLAAHPPALQQFARVALQSDFRDRLREMVKPTLVLQGTRDVIAPEVVGRFMAGELRDGRLAVLDEPGHFPQITAPVETTGAIREFVEGLGLAGR